MIMMSMVISRILGFVRDMIISNQFGQSYYTDAYNAAFSIPDFIYMILVGGAFSAAALSRTFSSYIAKGKEDEDGRSPALLWTLFASAFWYCWGLLSCLLPQLLGLIVKNFDAVTMDLAITLTTRIMLLQVVFMALAGICSGILQSYKIFGPTAYGGVVYNLGIIVIGGFFSGIVEKYFPGYGIAAFPLVLSLGLLVTFFDSSGIFEKCRYPLRLLLTCGIRVSVRCWDWWYRCSLVFPPMNWVYLWISI